MKLYTFPNAPSPRRVHLFLAEKGLQINQQMVDIRSGEHLQTRVLAGNPARTVPMLELDDGRCLSESAAICRYLEEFQPEPPLLGSNANDRAVIADCDHWIEMHGLLAVMEAFRNAVPRLKDRALPGMRPVAQIPALAKRGRERYGWFLEDLNLKLSKQDYVAGDTFSVADITALVAIDFARGGIKIDIPKHALHLRDWYQRINQRPAIQQAAT
ncbi:MAG: glutathione S-transferase family protein [Pseudomonadota bacterium]